MSEYVYLCRINNKRGGSLFVEVDPEKFWLYADGFVAPHVELDQLRRVPREWFSAYESARLEYERIQDQYHTFPMAKVRWEPRVTVTDTGACRDEG